MLKINLSQPGMSIKTGESASHPEIIFQHVIGDTTYMGLLTDRNSIKILGDACRRMNYKPAEPLDNETKKEILLVLATDDDSTPARLLRTLYKKYHEAITPPEEEVPQNKVPDLVRNLIDQVEMSDYETTDGLHPLKMNTHYQALRDLFKEQLVS